MSESPAGSPLPDDPLKVLPPERLAPLREVLHAANFTSSGIAAALDDRSEAAVLDDPLMTLWRTRGTSPLETFIRLFRAGLSVPLDVAQKAVAPTPLEDWLACGLLVAEGNEVRRGVALAPYQGLVIATDSIRRHDAHELRPNHVLELSSPSRILAEATIRVRNGSALDMAAGSGVQALLAARHSQHVVATDVNARALNMAVFNAALNGLANIDVRSGSMYEPVADETFDLIVANPPYVISPDSQFVFRDSGMTGDRVCELAVRGAAARLNEGGFCQALCNWAHPRSGDWKERITSWFADSNCDVWVLRNETVDSGSYACFWLRGTPDPTPETLQRWLDYYREQDIESVSVGLITMRRRTTGPNWIQIDDAPPSGEGLRGDAIYRAFQFRTLLASLPDPRALLTLRLRVSPNLDMQQLGRPGEQGWNIHAVQVHGRRELGYTGKLDQIAFALLSSLDGRQTLGDVLRTLAREMRGEVEVFEQRGVEIAQELLKMAFIWPADWRESTVPLDDAPLDDAE